MSKSAKSAGSAADRSECVKVAVRCRPLNELEKSRGERSIVDMNPKLGSVTLLKAPGAPVDNTPGGENKTFTFDNVFPPGTAQKLIYDQTARPIVDSVLAGYNGTIFAYGQTGTGKTFTMEGVPDSDDLRGIMPNSFYHIFDAVSQSAENMEFLVRASFIEIYLDDVYDLLNKEERTKMEVKESKEQGVFIKDLSTFVVKSVPDLLKVLRAGQKARKVGATKMNEGSSRSHSLLMITIEASEEITIPSEDKNAEPQKEIKYRRSVLNLVDLAGSERQKRTEAVGERLDEAKAINLSLSALGNVIKALINPNAKHIPFRDSKLTRLLQDSLGGNTKTVMIANLGPAELSFDETLSTLRYANRAKNIKNKPKINEDPKDAMLREYQEEIARLKAQLEARRLGMSGLSAGIDFAQLQMQQVTDADGTVHSVPAGVAEQLIEENLIIKEIVKETGITQEHLDKLKEKAWLEEEMVKAKTEKERENIMKKKIAVEKQVELYEEELKRKAQQLSKEKEEFSKLDSLIKQKEQQLIHGGVELEKAQQQKLELLKTEEALRKKREQEEKMKKELAEAQEAQLLLTEHYSSKEEELQKKSAKIKQLMKKYEERKQELAEIQEEFAVEKADLIDNIRELDRKLKLKQLVMESFIPESFHALLESACRWDSINQQWRIPGIELAGNNIERLINGGQFRSSAINQSLNRSGSAQLDGQVFLSYPDQDRRRKQ